MMRTPSFWYSGPGFLAWFLSPLGWLYSRATAQRLNKTTNVIRAQSPVICIGNVNAGGTGKTPTIIAMVEHLQKLGRTAVVVSRGYGKNLKVPTLVNPLVHSSDQVGDEPLLIAAFCQIIVTNNRVAGIELASKGKPDVILMDDGFQDPAVHKDFSIITVDASLGFGNGFCIPAGPLREPVLTGLKRADMCLSIGSKENQKKFLKKLAVPLGVVHVAAKVKPLLTGMRWEGLNAFAFAGIAHPEKFFLTLEGLGVNILGREALSDHQPLSLSLMRRMSAKAKLLNAQLVCTEKDFVRVPVNYRAEVLVLPVRLEIEDWSKIDLKLADLGLT